jgi:hypothetical protein
MEENRSFGEGNNVPRILSPSVFFTRTTTNLPDALVGVRDQTTPAPLSQFHLSSPSGHILFSPLDEEMDSGSWCGLDFVAMYDHSIEGDGQGLDRAASLEAQGDPGSGHYLGSCSHFAAPPLSLRASWILRPKSIASLLRRINALPLLSVPDRTVALSLPDPGHKLPALVEILVHMEQYALDKYKRKLSTIVTICFAAGRSSLIALALSRGMSMVDLKRLLEAYPILYARTGFGSTSSQTDDNEASQEDSLRALCRLLFHRGEANDAGAHSATQGLEDVTDPNDRIGARGPKAPPGHSSAAIIPSFENQTSASFVSSAVDQMSLAALYRKGPYYATRPWICALNPSASDSADTLHQSQSTSLFYDQSTTDSATFKYDSDDVSDPWVQSVGWFTDLPLEKANQLATGLVVQGNEGPLLPWQNGDPSLFALTITPHPKALVTISLDDSLLSNERPSDGQGQGSKVPRQPTTADLLLHSTLDSNWTRLHCNAGPTAAAGPTHNPLGATDDEAHAMVDGFSQACAAGRTAFLNKESAFRTAVDSLVARGPGKVFDKSDMPCRKVAI